MRIFYALIIFITLTTLSAANTENSTESFSYMLEEGTTFHARHPIEIDPYFSYTDHEVTIRIPERRQSSLWSTDLNEDWFNLNRTKIVLFFLQKPDGLTICLDFFWTRLGGAITLEGIPDQIVRNSLKQLLNFNSRF